MDFICLENSESFCQLEISTSRDTNHWKLVVRYKITKENIGGVLFSVKSLSETVDTLFGWCRTQGEGEPKMISFVNAHSVELTHRSSIYKDAVENSEIVSADGAGIILGSLLLGRTLRCRVCGPDVFYALTGKLNRELEGTKVFFLGSTNENLKTLKNKFCSDYPNLNFVGSYSPPFKSSFSPEDIVGMSDLVNSCGADVLWIGLGAPKQEILAQQLKPQVNVKVIAPIGGVFDFFTGRVKLPPMWAQKMGLIWLYRFCQQPRRLFRRTMDLPVFFCRVLVQRIRELFSQ